VEVEVEVEVEVGFGAERSDWTKWSGALMISTNNNLTLCNRIDGCGRIPSEGINKRHEKKREREEKRK